MKVKSFVVSECGNSADDAWGRAQAIASLENQAEPQANIGVLYKKGFKLVGKIQEHASTEEAHKSAHLILQRHKEATIDNDCALCLDAGGGEYYFIGRAQLDK